MINGIHIDIRGDELGGILHKNAKKYREKATKYEDQAKRLKEFDAARAREFPGSTSDDSTFDNFQRKAREAVGKADYFAFCADHLIPDETYRLSRDDLRAIEVVRGDRVPW